MNAAVVAIVCIALAGFVAAIYAPRTGVALWATAVVNCALCLAHVRPEANHPMRLIGPLLPMGLAYADMLDTSVDVRGYSIARLVFSLAFASEFAGLFFALWDQWPLPGATIAVCLGIVAHCFLPKGVFRWKRFWGL